MNKGFLTSKALCLIQLLLEYRGLPNLRCIVFVERVITAVVLESLLNEFLPEHNDWKSKHIAGNNSGMQSQTRKNQNEIVEEFRKWHGEHYCCKHRFLKRVYTFKAAIWLLDLTLVPLFVASYSLKAVQGG
ncbi:hypothetical protein ACLB2K_026933 [Fragaria x ananassa]